MPSTNRLPSSANLSPAHHAVANLDSKRAAGAQPAPGMRTLRQVTLAGGDRSDPAPALRRAQYVSPLNTAFWIEHHGREVLKALACIKELPPGPGNEVLVGEPWWAVRRPLEKLLRVAASGSAMNLADRIAGLGRGKDALSRDIILASQLAMSAPELVKAFEAAAPVLQKVVEHVKQLAKGSPNDAAQYVIANAVLVCGVASAARALQTHPDATSATKEALLRLREVAQALAQNRPDDLTDSLCWTRQREELGTVLGGAGMSIKAALKPFEPAPKATPCLSLDSKHLVPRDLHEVTGNAADQPPALIPVEPGLPDFGIRDSGAASRSQPATAETPDRPRVAAASSMLSPLPDADDPLEAPEFHTLNKPPQTPPQAGSLPAKKEPLKETKQGMDPSAAEVRASPAPSVGDSDEEAGQVQFHAGLDGELASPSRHLSMGAPPVVAGPDAPQPRVARPKR